MRLPLIFNSMERGQIFYGLHFSEGVAEYAPADGEPYRIFVNEKTAKAMDPTFSGCPVYVKHVDEVNGIGKGEEDGYVVESFFNKSDGRHWAKMVIVTEKGLDHIKRGWTLSNAYRVIEEGPGGEWHGVQYKSEVRNGKYEHLAIVNDPRYSESIILTPAEFKAYNLEKESELLRLANSKGEKMKFSFFKKTTIENSKELADTMVTLPESKKEMSVADALEKADKFVVQNAEGYCNPKHLVNVGNDEMAVGDLVNRHLELMKKNSEMEESMKKNQTDAELEKKENEDKAEKKAEGEEEKQNADDKKDEEKKENEEDKKEDKKENSKETADLHFNSLAQAHMKPIKNEQKIIELSEDRVARGKARYGSQK